MSDPLTRHLAAVMFTDMAGYSVMMQTDEAAALRSRHRHRSAVERGLEAHNGRLLQYFGDGSLSIFTSSVQAVKAAVDIQRTVGRDPPLRVGLHAGDIAYDVQGAYGDAVNIAARLEALCPPGGVTISKKIYDDIRRHPELPVVPLGSLRLKNIEESVPTFALAVDGLALPTPEDPETDRPDPEDGFPAELLARLEELGRYAADPHAGLTTVPGRVPLVGRRSEMEEIRRLMELAEGRRSAAIFLRGPRGVGKTRITQEVVRFARERGWIVLRGRAHPSERLVPYAPFADAFVPLLRGLDAETLARLTPGSDAALCSLFPALGPPPRPIDIGPSTPGEHRTRLYWQFAGAVSLLTSRRPVLLALEDLDFADRASLELLDFLTRQTEREPLVVLGEYTGADPDRRQSLRALEHALVSAGRGHVFPLDAFDPEETRAFVEAAFGLEGSTAERLAEATFLWSRGNPFFMNGTLRGLIESGALRNEDGVWTVGDLDDLRLPHSVRDAVLVWLGQLGPRALEVARVLAIVGREVSYEVLRLVTDVSDAELGPALDELVRHQLVQEAESRWTLAYAFRNPLIRETLRSEMGLAERRQLHTAVARSLEAFYGDGADDHAEELAYHFSRAQPGAHGTKTIHYLARAGRSALRRHANQEAADSLQEALDRIEAAPSGSGLDRYREEVLRGLARARRRIGEYAASASGWQRLLTLSREQQDAVATAEYHRELGMTHLASGALEEATEHLAAATEYAGATGRIPLVVRAQLAEAFCLENVGRSRRADEVIESSLMLAREFGDARVLGQVQRSRIQQYLWTGRIAEGREAARSALALCEETGDRGVEFWSRWALGALEGLVGNTAEMAAHVALARDIADEVGSPFFDLATRELSIELANARGEWDRGIQEGTRAIELARATQQRLILPRLLVWTARMHLGRGNFDVADALTREAWEVSDAGGVVADRSFVGLHSVVPAHIGRANYYLATGEWQEAIRLARAALALADDSGYVVWSIHHVLPILGEAAIHARDLELADRAGRRIREEAERIGHPLARAWADACEGVLTWLQNDAHAGVRSLEAGARALEAIPITFEAARLRRQLAGRLAEVGERERALEELRGAYEVFRSLGARPELEKARIQFGELGAEAPPEHDAS